MSRQGGGIRLRVASEDAFPHSVTLKDGLRVLIRRAEPEDFRMLFSMFNSLSTDTMFGRFLRSQMRLAKGEVQEMLGLEDENVTSLIAVVEKDHEKQAIGEARYVTDSAGKLAEAAVVIADEWQNRGLGTALFSDLIAEARRRGLAKVFAYFDVENKSIMRVGQKVGFRLAPKEGATDYSMMKAEIVL